MKAYTTGSDRFHITECCILNITYKYLYLCSVYRKKIVYYISYTFDLSCNLEMISDNRYSANDKLSRYAILNTNKPSHYLRRFQIM